MSEDDIATFLTSQTMVDGIVLATDTGSCHRVISEVDSLRYLPQLYTLHEDEKKNQYMNRVL